MKPDHLSTLNSIVTACFFGTWIVLVFGGSLFFQLGRDGTRKRKWFPRYIVISYVLFIMFSTTLMVLSWRSIVTLSALVIMVPAFCLISWLNIKSTTFCGQCGSLVRSSIWSSPTGFCPKCGAGLDAKPKIQGDLLDELRYARSLTLREEPITWRACDDETSGGVSAEHGHAAGWATGREFACLLGIGLLAVTAAAQALTAPSPAKKVWDFQHDAPGGIARGVRAESGRWEVVAVGKNLVLAQTARSDDDTFNLALIEGTSVKDVDLGVRLRAVEGEPDQGGGLVWRAKDAKNYYIARYNPLEDNSRVYKVENGKRTQFRSAKIPGDRKWHTLHVIMTGSRIVCALDGVKYLEVEDTTFPDAGKIGLWSKADARSYFDDLTLGAPGLAPVPR